MKGCLMLDTVKITPLKIFSDNRGSVKHMMKCTDETFSNFGEIYFSTILPGNIKGWYRNKTTTVNYAVIEGNIQLIVSDGEIKKEILMGDDNYCLVTIPPGIWRAFRPHGGRKAIVADLTDKPHNPLDTEKKDPKEFIKCWD